MSAFETQVEVAKVGILESGVTRWKLRRQLVYVSDRLGRKVIVPRGFVTDFASVPRIPIVYLVTGDTVHAPAVIHDWLYTEGTVIRSEADKVFLEAMEASGVPRFRRYAMYAAVRLFGGSYYKQASA